VSNFFETKQNMTHFNTLRLKWYSRKDDMDKHIKTIWIKTCFKLL